MKLLLLLCSVCSTSLTSNGEFLLCFFGGRVLEVEDELNWRVLSVMECSISVLGS